MNTIRYFNTDITGGFWKEKQNMVKNITAQAVYDRFNDTHRFDALKCKPWTEESGYKPHIFWDSDVAKWIEGVAYIMRKESVPELQRLAQAAIDDIVDNAMEDGYFNSHFQAVRINERFTVRSEHELYCAGHLIEAAVAWFETTGDDRFLKAMCKYADLIEKVFAIDQSAPFVTPGHPELELALVRLADAANEPRYMRLAKFFVDQHGANDKDTPVHPEVFNEYYTQDHLPLKEQTTVEGHSVRILYLMSAMADVAHRRGDRELMDACKRLFDNAVNKRMYVTGGMSSTHIGEAFTIDYDLPGRTAYTETCCTIALALVAERLQAYDPKTEYADAAERAIYNGFLSGISMDGKSFFYENPLTIDPDFNNVNTSTLDKERYPITERVEVFSCSCCPPNVVRFIPSIADMMYTYDDDILYVNHYIDSKTSCGNISISQSTAYPACGRVVISCNIPQKKLALRIPAWCKSFTLSAAYTMERGYALIDVCGEAEITLELDMPVETVYANPRVHDCAGRIAVSRGPIIYCMEGIDNGTDLSGYRLDVSRGFELADAQFMLPNIRAHGVAPKKCSGLYMTGPVPYEEKALTFIPYYAFANRGETEMLVWVIEK